MPKDDGPTEVQYDLERQPNDGNSPLGRSGAVTFYDLRDDSTLVKLDLAASLNRRPELGPPEVSFAGSIKRNRRNRRLQALRARRALPCEN